MHHLQDFDTELAGFRLPASRLSLPDTPLNTMTPPAISTERAPSSSLKPFHESPQEARGCTQKGFHLAALTHQEDPSEAECLLCERRISRYRVIGHLLNASITHHMRIHHKQLCIAIDTGWQNGPQCISLSLLFK